MKLRSTTSPQTGNSLRWFLEFGAYIGHLDLYFDDSDGRWMALRAVVREEGVVYQCNKQIKDGGPGLRGRDFPVAGADVSEEVRDCLRAARRWAERNMAAQFRALEFKWLPSPVKHSA